MESQINHKQEIKEKYLEYITIIIKTNDKSIELENKKFLVKNNITLGQFLFSIKKECIKNINENDMIYGHINKKLYTFSKCLLDIFNIEKNNENILEILISKNP